MPWLRANLATYFYNYDNLQVTARAADNSFVLQNAASAEIYGGELELFVDPVTGLNLRAALAYAHSEYVDFPNAQVFYPNQAAVTWFRPLMHLAISLSAPQSSL